MNNKELKFRGFWKSVSKMIYFANGLLCWSENGKVGMFIPSTTGQVYLGEPIMMQYTGLKDKDGKEAYEGDIIEFVNTEGKLFRKEINWNEELQCICFGNISYQELHESAYHQPSKIVFQIIGNIYQNEHLLNQQT